MERTGGPIAPKSTIKQRTGGRLSPRPLVFSLLARSTSAVCRVTEGRAGGESPEFQDQGNIASPKTSVIY